MRRNFRLVASTLVIISLLVALLGFDRRVGHVIARLRFGHLTLIAQAHFARQASEWSRTADRDAPNAAAVYTAAAHTVSVVSGGVIARDTVFVDYTTTMQWCPQIDEPNILQVVFAREPDGWHLIRAGAYPC